MQLSAWDWAAKDTPGVSAKALDLFFQNICAHGSHKSKSSILERARRTWAQLPVKAILPILNQLWNMDVRLQEKSIGTLAGRKRGTKRRRPFSAGFPNRFVQLGRLDRRAVEGEQKKKKEDPSHEAMREALERRLADALDDGQGFSHGLFFYDTAMTGCRLSRVDFSRDPLYYQGARVTGWCPGHGEGFPRSDRPCARVRLDEDEEERRRVAGLFSATCDPATWYLLDVHRIENERLWTAFGDGVRRASEQKAVPCLPHVTAGVSPAETQWLFHGTDEDTVHTICTRGFNRSFAGQQHGARLGKGTYFATSSQCALDFASSTTATRYVLVCRVRTGLYTVGNPAYQAAPPLVPDSALVHDSTVDHLLQPREFACFQDHQAYPMYVLQVRGWFVST